MNRFLLACGLAVAPLLLLSAPQVRADGIDTFTFTETVGTDTTVLTWQLPAIPIPDAIAPDTFFVTLAVQTAVSVNGVVQPTVSEDFFFFANGFNSGGLAEDQFGFFLAGVGPVFSGTPDTPSFTCGTYSGLDSGSVFDGASETLVISTPEPSVFLMVFAGLIALFGGVALKKVSA